jgi:hypothetical protein
LSEQNTQKVLVENKLCLGCDGGECLPPYSLVFFARLTVGDLNFTLSCDELSTQWVDYKDDVEAQLLSCVAAIKQSYSGEELPESCPTGFNPVLVDELFGETDGNGKNTIVRYTSSIFATIYDVDALYKVAGEYDRAYNSEVVQGVYDNGNEDFVNQAIDSSLSSDMALALGSAVVTTLAMLVHTRSPWITLIGLCQIILSFPVAYFVYSLIARLEFFPFLNFIGVFVTFALGSDDVFVAVDKFKNARLDHKDATTEQIAAIALPDAAEAMFLTSVCLISLDALLLSCLLLTCSFPSFPRLQLLLRSSVQRFVP